MNNTYKKALIDSLYFRAGRYLAIRPRSKKEFSDYLKRKLLKKQLTDEIKMAVINGVIRVAEEEKLLDDTAFALWWIEDRTYFKPRGRRALESELMGKGVAHDIIAEAIDSFELDEVSLAKKILVSRQHSFLRLSIEKRQNTIRSLLGRRGFTGETIKKAIEDLAEME